LRARRSSRSSRSSLIRVAGRTLTHRVQVAVAVAAFVALAVFGVPFSVVRAATASGG